MEVLNERSYFKIRVVYSNIPVTARYRIDCKTSQQVVQDWVDYAVSGIADVLTITPEQNAIINSFNPEEQKELVVMTDKDTATQFVGAFEWVVINLQGVS